MPVLQEVEMGAASLSLAWGFSDLVRPCLQIKQDWSYSSRYKAGDKTLDSILSATTTTPKIKLFITQWPSLVL